MIKNIFIPEQIGSHYIFPKRILGFDIGKIHVSALQILLKGTTITIEKCITVPLEANTVPYEERVSKALMEILQQVDAYDAIHSSISSSLVVFKELKLPFTAHNKISMVIDYEVEPLLPFPIHDAVIDFIITKQNFVEKNSEILVTAIQKHHIASHLQLFAAAGIDPTTVTVDAFALYGLYQLIPVYSRLEGGVALLDLGAYTTTILYIYNGQLRLVRGLQKGILNLAKNSAQALNSNGQDVMENIIRFGVDKDADPAYLKTVGPMFTAFWQEIAFTLSSFTAQTEQHQMINNVFLLGGGANIKGITAFASQQLGVPCEIFQSNKLLSRQDVVVASKTGLSNTYTMALATSLTTPTTALFNVRKKEFSLMQNRLLFNKQSIIAFALVIVLLASLTINSFWQIYRLNDEAHQAEQEAIELLKSHFKIPANEENLEDILQQATNEVRREQKLWFSFANPGRTPFLAYLLELTNRIDKENLGFSIDSLRITENVLTLTGHVKDYKELALLEKELKKSKLFMRIEGLQTPDFEMRIRLN